MDHLLNQNLCFFFILCRTVGKLFLVIDNGSAVEGKGIRGLRMRLSVASAEESAFIEEAGSKH